MSAAISCTAAQTESEHHSTSQLDINIPSFQDIRRGNIDPEKLVALLRRRFGAGRYEIYTIHNVFSVRAPERLSQNDIELCK
ncbi:hypothetical protein F4801DRAFT_540887 [Xylaria longipes]|nr:hypothetical protein F4801DRAFT_540887 [Xylaria longipes]